MFSLIRCGLPSTSIGFWSTNFDEQRSLVPISPSHAGTITVPGDSPPSSPWSTGKRLKRVPSKEQLVTPEEESDIILLKQVFMEPKMRQKLIMALLPCDTDAAVKARFCVAMEEFSTISNLAERRAKGNKIVAMFIRNGSMFQCSGVPKDVQNEVVWKSFDMLRLLRNQFELELVQLSETRVALHKLTSAREQSTSPSPPRSKTSNTGSTDGNGPQ